MKLSNFNERVTHEQFAEFIKQELTAYLAENGKARDNDGTVITIQFSSLLDDFGDFVREGF